MTFRRILLLVFFVIVLILGFRYCEFKDRDSSSLESDTDLIRQQIVSVGKLVVTEGHFSEVLTYKDQQGYFMNLLTFKKKALLIVNADVTVAYDLRQVKYDIDQENKTITTVSIPKEEIKISPDIKFYDVDQSSMNAFTGEDYNKISRTVKANLQKKIARSTLQTNAKNRLVSELSKILILTNSMGWTLVYNGENVTSETDLSNSLQP